MTLSVCEAEQDFQPGSFCWSFLFVTGHAPESANGRQVGGGLVPAVCVANVSDQLFQWHHIGFVSTTFLTWAEAILMGSHGFKRLQ